jgi:hypothetical protein
MPCAIHSLREVFILSETTNRLNFGPTQKTGIYHIRLLYYNDYKLLLITDDHENEKNSLYALQHEIPSSVFSPSRLFYIPPQPLGICPHILNQ